MKTTDEHMAELQPIIDRIAGGPYSAEDERAARERIAQMTAPHFSPLVPRFHTCKAADNLPPGCDGCRVDLAGNEICPCKERDNG